MLFLLFLAILGVAAGLVTAQLLADDTTGGGSSSGAAPVVTGIHDFDPLGDNRRRIPTRSASRSTAIRTPRGEASNTRTPASSVAAKPVWASSSTSRRTPRSRASSIDGEPGASVEIYVSDASHATLDGWGRVRAASTDLPESATLTLDPSVNGRVVLVWFTLLPGVAPTRRPRAACHLILVATGRPTRRGQSGAVDDDALAVAARAGDRAALEQLLELHTDRIHAVCRRIVGHPEDALDATQEAMIAVARGITRFDGQSRVSTWIYRVATNAALDEVRRQAPPPRACRSSGQHPRRR